MVKLNAAGEVADYVNVSQFEQGESAYECGFFTVWLNKAAGAPGTGATQSAEWIDQQADASYSKYDGVNTSANTNGMSLWQLWTLLTESGQAYQWLGNTPDLALIKAWLAIGMPVILTVDENSVYDVALGKVPYSWTPTGTHIITASGISLKGNLLIRDTASIGTDGVRPGPREYDIKKLKINQATALVVPWLPALPANFNPLASPAPFPSEQSYIVQPGDTLYTIASEHHTSIANLLANNADILDATARFHGYQSSNDGSWIFPGTRLTWS